MSLVTTARNATLGDLAAILRDQQARKVDVVAPATALRSRDGIITVRGAEAQLTEDGVTTVDGTYRPTAGFDAQVADKLGVPLAYVRRMRAERPDLYDANVNGWLHGRTMVRNGEREVIAAADRRRFLFRGFRGDDGGIGVARALLSDRFGGVTDNLDALTAALDGVRSAGVQVDVTACDLTENRMYVKVAAPAVAALAPTLLAGYRSPYSGLTGDENPLVFAGFRLTNSETGGGAFTITPEITVQVCTNGLTMTRDAMKSVHLGGRLEEGPVRWSATTQRASLDLIKGKASDAVAAFLDVEYLRSKIAEMEVKAGVPVVDAAATVEQVGKRLAFTEAEIASTLDHFIRGGQMTAGGIMQAVTAFVQQVDDADRAWDLSGKAVEAMELAAARR